MSQTITQSPPLTRSAEKLDKTRNEIDKLKTEIETLISTNIKNNIILQQLNVASTVTVDTNLSKSPAKTEPILTKSFPSPVKLKSPVSVRRSTRSQSHKSEPNLLLALEEECKSKARNYDSKITRDFIKKQRKKRKLKSEEAARHKNEITELTQKRLADLQHNTQKLLLDQKVTRSSRINTKPSEDRKPKTGKTDDFNFKAEVENKPSVDGKSKTGKTDVSKCKAQVENKPSVDGKPKTGKTDVCMFKAQVENKSSVDGQPTTGQMDVSKFKAQIENKPSVDGQPTTGQMDVSKAQVENKPSVDGKPKPGKADVSKFKSQVENKPSVVGKQKTGQMDVSKAQVENKPSVDGKPKTGKADVSKFKAQVETKPSVDGQPTTGKADVSKFKAQVETKPSVDGQPTTGKADVSKFKAQVENKPSVVGKRKTYKTDAFKFKAQIENKRFTRDELQIRRCRYRSFDHEPKVIAKKPLVTTNVLRLSPQRSKSVNRELRFDKLVADKQKIPMKAKSQESLEKPNKSPKVNTKVDNKLLNTLEGLPKTNKSKLGTNSTASQTSFSLPESGLNLDNKQNTFIKDDLSHSAVFVKQVKEKRIAEVQEKGNTEVKEKYTSPFNFKFKFMKTNSIENIPPELTENINQNETSKEINALREKLETSISQIKEDKRREFPIWLQQCAIQPYPYNFISAVRKKLEIETKNNVPKANSGYNNKNEIIQNTEKEMPTTKTPLDLQSVAIPQLVPPEITKHSNTYTNSVDIPQLIPPEVTKHSKSYSKSVEIPQLIPPQVTEPSKTKKIVANSQLIPQLTELSKIRKSVDNLQLIPPQVTERSKTRKSIDISQLIPLQVTEPFKTRQFADTPQLIPPQVTERSKTRKSMDISQLIPPQVIEHSKTYNSHKVRKQLDYSNEPEEILASNSNKQSTAHSNNSNRISIDSDDSTTKNVPELPHEDAGNIPESIDKNVLQKIFLKFPKERKMFTRQLSNILSISNSSNSDFAIPKNITLERNFDVPDLKLTITDHKSEKRYNLPEDIDRILNQYSDRVKSNQTSTISATEYEEIAINLPKKSKSAIASDKKDPSLSNGITNLPKKSDTSKTKTEPQLTFVSENVINSPEICNANIPKLVKPNLSLNPHKNKLNAQSNSNHIHLKLQAEVQLINSFNNSLQKVVSVEKSLYNTINFKRGCDLSDKENSQHDNLTICPRDLTLSRALDNKSISSSIVPKQQEIVIRTNDNPYVSLSLGLVDQMIQDEDVRLQHLSSIIKIRDKTLFDRTKGEIAWLEIQKKQFKENGQVEDVTSIKKKQRGLLIKLEQERYEMRRLKQAHKEAAKARKTALCEQKNVIKHQLASTDQIPRKLRRLSNAERPKFGPVKVTSFCESTLYRVDAQREVTSQSSSRRDARDATTDSSMVQKVGQIVIHQTHTIETEEEVVVAVQLIEEDVKKELSMKEANLDIRRKVAEEVLQWRQRLEQEEEVVVELERRAAKPILLDDDPEKTRYFTGEQLNKIWNGFTGFSEMKYDTSKKYKMSKRSLDKLFQSAMKRLKELPEESRRSKLSSGQPLSSYSSTLDSSSSIATEIKNLSNKSSKSAKRVSQIKGISDKFDSNVSTEENSLISNNFNLEKSNKTSTIGSVTQNKNTSLDQQSFNLEGFSDELNDNIKLSELKNSEPIRTNSITSRKTTANRTNISKKSTNLETASSKSEASKVSTLKTSVSKVSTILDDDLISAYKNDLNSESEIIPSARSKITEEAEIPVSKSLTVSEEVSSVKTESECVLPEESINTAVTESSNKVHDWFQLNYNSSKNVEDDKATTVNESIVTEISNYASDSSRKESPIEEELSVEKSKISGITSVDDITDSVPIESDKISNVRTELSTNFSDSLHTDCESISFKINEEKKSESIIESVETNLENVSNSVVSGKESASIIESVETNLENVSNSVVSGKESESIIESIETNWEDVSLVVSIKESESIIESVETNLENISNSVVSEKRQMKNDSASSEIKEEILSFETSPVSSTARSIISEKLSFYIENGSISLPKTISAKSVVSENNSIFSEIKEDILCIDTNLEDAPKSEKPSFHTENESVSSEIKEEIVSVDSKSTTARSVISNKLSVHEENDSVSSEIKEEVVSVETTPKSIMSDKLFYSTDNESAVSEKLSYLVSSEITENILSDEISPKSTSAISIISKKQSVPTDNESVSSEIKEEVLSIDTNTAPRSVVSEKFGFHKENDSSSSEIKYEIVPVEYSSKSTLGSVISEKLSFLTDNESISSKIKEGFLSVETNLEEILPKTATASSNVSEKLSSEINEDILSVATTTNTVISEKLSVRSENESIETNLEDISPKSTIPKSGTSEEEEDDNATVENHSDATSIQSNDQLVEVVLEKMSDAESNQFVAVTSESKIESDKSIYSVLSSIRSNGSTKSNVSSEVIIDLPTDKFQIEIQEELIIVLESPKSEELQKSGLIESSVQSAKTVDEEPNIVSADSFNSMSENNSATRSKSEESVQEDSAIQDKSLSSIDQEETLHKNQEMTLHDKLFVTDASPRKSEISEQLEKSSTSAKLESASEYDNESFEDKNSDISQKSSAKTSIKSEKFLVENKKEPSTDENVELFDTKPSSSDISLESEKSIEEINKLEPLTESLEIERTTGSNVDFPDATEDYLNENNKLVPSSESLQKTFDQNASSPGSNETFNRSGSNSTASDLINIKSSNSSPRSTKSHQENTSSEILENSLDNSGSLEENKVTSGMDDTNVKGIKYVDVFKRVSEILADMTSPRADKSPRVQDLYTTTYDIVGTSSENTSESGSPSSELSPPDKTKRIKQTPFRNEEEELLRKQLAIEREIKRIEQETIPFAFVREIPNKPPPPYKPPDFPLTHVVTSIIPTKPEKAKELISKAHDTIFNAYIKGELSKVEYKSLKDPKEDLQRFVFDLCKEVALNVCKPKVENKIPSWKTLRYGVHSFVKKRSMDNEDLHGVLNKKVLQLLNFEPSHRNDSLIIRWCLKKRDHVDEILVLETQTEEPDWTNYVEDEDVVKENLTQSILNMLLDDTARNISKIMEKKKSFRWS